MIETVTAVRVLRPFVLEVGFEDGVQRQVDREPYLDGEVIQPLRASALLAGVYRSGERGKHVQRGSRQDERMTAFEKLSGGSLYRTTDTVTTRNEAGTLTMQVERVGASTELPDGDLGTITVKPAGGAAVERAAAPNPITQANRKARGF